MSFVDTFTGEPATLGARPGWTQLKGATEVSANGSCSSDSGSNCVGAMIGARGCIVYDATTELTDSTGTGLPGTGIYTVSIAWQ